MRKLGIALLVLLLLAGVTLALLLRTPQISEGLEISEADDAILRGEYLFIAGGCISCHLGEEDDELPSGGLALETDFGTFYAPNITPDPDNGVGGWSARDFLAAMKHGRAPDGRSIILLFPTAAMRAQR